MSESTTTRLQGMVKWFNSKAGYGFITVCGEERDIFVHYSNIKVANLPYTYLSQGEYVEFELAETTNEQHKFQAVNITGIAGGPILCETRRNIRQVGGNRDDGSEQEQVKRVRRQPPRTPRVSYENDNKTGDEGFTTIKKRNPRKSD
jgi:CspA family cold shock protein